MKSNNKNHNPDTDIKNMTIEPKLNKLTDVVMCDACLDGVGGECHVPGCIMFLSAAPDIKIRDSILSQGGTITSIPDLDKIEHRCKSCGYPIAVAVDYCGECIG